MQNMWKSFLYWLAKKNQKVLIIIKVFLRRIRKYKASQQRSPERYWQHIHNGIDDWQLTLVEQCNVEHKSS